ncbi:MAG TPA: TolC family protein [Chitinophagaceae bacterium]|nr:TolC family protein [Chitinophagaceae bacterium]
MKIAKYFIILFFAFGTFPVQAQESLASGIDYAFLQKLIDTAKSNYPKMKSFNHKIIIASNDIRKAKLSWFDIFTVSAFYSPTAAQTLTNPTLSGFQLGLFLNISSLIQKPVMLRQSHEALKIAQLDKDEYNLNLEADVKSRYFKYIQQVTILKVQTQAALDAESLSRQFKYKFEKGEDTFENYSKSMILSSDQRQRVIEAEGSVLIAKSSIEELIGKKLEDIH